ncbi:MAG: TraR/DksA C4-type zinc finger protein [Candidatus Zixiibacteriota bacterium]|nr:MAG: TraR/DksA C4-type zinc finger protein [candidate division Zixibacteria bacterium]
MKKSDLKKYEAALLKKRDEMLREMGKVEDGHGKATLKEATGDLSSHSYHMADQGTDHMEREMAFMVKSKSGRLVYHIDEALRRIKDGSYGACQSCGKQISASRLNAVPHARMCIDCKSAEEVKKTGRR